MHSRITVLSLKIIARQVRRYAYCVALLCALGLILAASFFIGVGEKLFQGKDDEAICK